MKRGDEWLELVNPAEVKKKKKKKIIIIIIIIIIITLYKQVFARIMVDYSYCELTSACVQGLAAFAKAGDEAKEYRRAEVC